MYSKRSSGHSESSFESPNKNFSHKIENWQRKFYQKKYYPRNVPLDIQKLNLTTVTRELIRRWAETFLPKAQKCSDEIPKLIKKSLSFFKKFFSAQFSFRHLESRFGCRCKKLQLNVNYSLLKVMKRWNRFCSQLFYSKSSPGHLESGFDNSTENLSHKAQKWQKKLFRKN